MMDDYESPVKIIYGQMQTQFEDDILKAVQSYRIEVNKEELIKALRHDRGQFDKGYAVGYADGYGDACAEAKRPKWISVEDRLPGKQHDWVLVACKFVPEGWRGVPHIAEFRNGVWWADCHDAPLAKAGPLWQSSPCWAT